MTMLNNGMSMEDALSHYGVPGMKWGIRKAFGTNYTHAAGKQLVKVVKDKRAAAVRKKHSTASDDFKTAHALRKKKPHQLSNAEMQALVNRVNLERQYASLNISAQAKARKLVGDTIAKAGNAAVQTVIKETVTVAIKDAIQGAKK